AGPDYRQVKSWCALELDVDSYKRVTVISVNMPAPPMTVLCLAIHAKDTEVAAVSGVVYGNIDLDANTAVHHGCAQSQFTVVVRNKADDTAGPFILASDEQGLLNVLVSKVALIDPDIVAGHNMLDFELDFLLHRIGAQKVPRWSRIGRLRRDVFPKLGAASSRATFQVPCYLVVLQTPLKCYMYGAAHI
ncbi:MAG: hypothetical protein EBS90_09620, partial [Betaproteobacteria bacterium]|nr:hypothetical protein [Betaproteobacteria bacterium]